MLRRVKTATADLTGGRHGKGIDVVGLTLCPLRGPSCGHVPRRLIAAEHDTHRLTLRLPIRLTARSPIRP